MSEKFVIHARTVTGLEPVLAQELRELGAIDIEEKRRLVICRGSLETLYRANLWCRAAIRILRPIAVFSAKDEKSLYDGVRTIDWSKFLKPQGYLAIDGDTRSSFTTHSLFVAQLSKDAIVDRFRETTGTRPTVNLENPDLRVVVSLYKDEAQLFVDSSNDSLHRRGYRKRTGEAPLNETLAAGIIKLSGWDQKTPLVDPMCGSGTFVIEAGLIAKNIAPGLLRQHYGFQSWDDFDATLWERLLIEAKAKVRREKTPDIVGLEKDPSMISVARENVERAGLNGVVRIEKGDFFSWGAVPKEPGTLVMNPPYDERIAVKDLVGFSRSIFEKIRTDFRLWKVSVLSGNSDSLKYLAPKGAHRIEMFNGAIECELVQFEVPLNPGSVFEPEWNHDTTLVRPEWKSKVDTFSNRLRKNFKHLSKWAKREGVSVWRVYDRDIPELPFIVDVFQEAVHFSEIEKNYDHSPVEHDAYVKQMRLAACEVLQVPENKCYFKRRKPLKTGGVAAAENLSGEFFEVSEGGHRFFVNLRDYFDAGIFIEHRKTRAWVQSESKDKDFLNLYSYSGTLSVYAACGGARSTTSVDTVKTYLDWTKNNLELNGFTGERHKQMRADVLEFLKNVDASFDLCVVDPPSRTVSRSSGETFDIQKDHPALLRLVFRRMRPGGKVLFTTGYRSFQLNEKALRLEYPKIQCRELTGALTPPDFEKRQPFRAWELFIIN